MLLSVAIVMAGLSLEDTEATVVARGLEMVNGDDNCNGMAYLLCAYIEESICRCSLNE